MSSRSAEKRKDFESLLVAEPIGHEAFLPFLTYFPVGNPLLALAAHQRLIFFDSILRSLHIQREEIQERTRSFAEKIIVSASGFPLLSVPRKALQEVKSKAGLAGKGGAGAYIEDTELQKARIAVTLVIDDYAKGDMEKACYVLEDFEKRLEEERYKAKDIMAVLLIVIEDNACSGDASMPGGGEILPGKPSGAGIRISKGGQSQEISGMEKKTVSEAELLVPAKLRNAAKGSAEIRLASVREMLSYYFAAHPEDYSFAIGAALGVTSEQCQDPEFIHARIASVISHIGAYRMSGRMLAAIKMKRKITENDCLLRIGYKYDKKGKKLIIGKRVCGKPIDSNSILQLLLSLARGSAKGKRGGKGGKGRKGSSKRIRGLVPSRLRRPAARD